MLNEKDPCILKIIDRIQSAPQQAIPFDEYMELCLFDPEYGYYTGEAVRVGKEGDFYTSTYLGSLMGEMLLKYAYMQRPAWFDSMDAKLRFVEWGGGEGRLALHILDELQRSYPLSYERARYICIEASEGHRQSQRELLQAHLEHVVWMTSEQWFQERIEDRTIVLSNELIDAFPVKRAVYLETGWHELYVGWDNGQQQFQTIPMALEIHNPINSYLQTKSVAWKHGQHIEVNFQGMDWLRKINEQLAKQEGCLITIDYGDVDEHLFSPYRMQGTLQCYYRHQEHDDPFLHPGNQDMTAHVNFSDLIHIGEEAGIAEWSLFTQKQFLLEAGILEELQSHHTTDPFHPVAKRNRFIRQLLLNDAMGAAFKVFIQWCGAK